MSHVKTEPESLESLDPVDSNSLESELSQSAGSTAARVTLKHVAEQAGVSVSTVSLVLNRAPRSSRLAEATRERVLETAQRLGYRPNALARSLRGTRTRLLGLIVPELSEGYTAGIVAGVESCLGGAGYSYLLVSHRSDAERLEECVRVLEDRGAEGLVIIGAAPRGQVSLPTVCVARSVTQPLVGTVSLDHDRAADLALGHLSELGHRRIAVLRGAPSNIDAADRWRAIERAAREHGVEIPEDLALELQSPSYGESLDPEGGYREGFEYGRRLLAAEQVFSAVFAFNDISAIGVIRALHDAGRRVPDDVSVLGFDDLAISSFVSPRLTTIRQPLRAIGEAAAKRLLDHLDQGAPLGQDLAIEPELVVRASTGPASSG